MAQVTLRLRARWWFIPLVMVSTVIPPLAGLLRPLVASAIRAEAV